jgi:hypothetical protein
MIRKLRTSYFEKLIIQHIPFTLEENEMYQDLMVSYWWYGTKRDIAE